MIAFFPKLYTDELLYSAFARYLDKSGYGIYRAAAEDLYMNPLVKPDMLFVNELRSEVIDIITKQKPWEDIITQHTMYPYYGRFLPQERRQKAFRSLVNMDGNHKNLLHMPQDGKADQIRLRYCPVCCQHDRKIFGETYWHRTHQMHGINTCPEHGCKLIDSDIAVRAKSSPGLFSAESRIAGQDIVAVINPLELKLTKYVAELFKQAVADVDVPFHKYLREKIAGTKYTSPRGEQKNVTLLYQDFMTYYSDYDDNPVTELWRLQKTVDGKQYHTKEIAMVAMFMGVSPSELARLEMPSELCYERFDRKVRELHDQGLKYPQIAKIMGAPLDVVKPIGERRYGKYVKGRSKNKGGIRARDWDKIDAALLPKVKAAIAAIYGDDIDRPRRVTVNSVSKHLELPGRQIENCPRCMDLIAEHYESWEQYWCREMRWAVKVIEKDGANLTMTNLGRLTNTKRSNLRKALPFLEQHMDIEDAEKIRRCFVK